MAEDVRMPDVIFLIYRHCIYIIMALWFSGNTIYFMQTCIEPLRTVWYASLVQDRIYQFIIKYCASFADSKITIPSPHTLQQCAIRCATCLSSFPAHSAIWLWYTCFAEIFLCQDICCDLAPLFRHFHIVHLEYHFSLGF